MTKIDDKRLQIFGEHILKLREGKNLSQDDVSEGCRLTKATISVIENGKRNFTFSTLIALAKGLGVQPKELLDLDLKLHLDD